MQCSDTQTSNFFKKERQEADQSAGGSLHATLLLYQEMQILPSPPWPKEQHYSKAAGERCVVRVLATYPGSLQVAKAGYLAAVILHEVSGVPCVT